MTRAPSRFLGTEHASESTMSDDMSAFGSADEPEEDYMAARRAEVRAAMGRLIARPWMDEEFKRALIANPRRCLEAEGVDFPARYTIEFYEDPSAELGDW